MIPVVAILWVKSQANFAVGDFRHFIKQFLIKIVDYDMY